MKKRFPKFLASVLGGCLLGGIFIWYLYSHRRVEPVYEGKSLSLWLEDLDEETEFGVDVVTDGSGNDSILAPSGKAIRQMGTNALPVLVRMIGTRDSFYGEKSSELAKKWPEIKNLPLIPKRSAAEERYLADKAFFLLDDMVIVG